MRRKPSRRLFRYLSFSNYLLEQLCAGQIHFSDPSNFNDPFDCQPLVKADLPNNDLKEILAQLVIRRAGKEIDRAMNRLRLRGDLAVAKRQKLTEREVSSILGEIEYQATNPDIESPEGYIRFALEQAIQMELRRVYDRGVLCLAEKCDSALMWSHYANQHRGVCLEYDASQVSPAHIRKVEYGKSREIAASVIRKWLTNDEPDARRRIETASLFTKSREWAYEREWRMVGGVGPSSSLIEVKAITFGLRCPDVQQYTIVKLLGGTESKVRFWTMLSPGSRFALKRAPIDVDELMASMPLRSVALEFEDLDQNDRTEEPK